MTELTEANSIFLGLMTNAQRVHIAEVANSDRFCAPETFSTGLVISEIPAITNPHFNVGAQKCTVLGPVLLFQKFLNAILIVDISLASKTV